MQAKIGDRIVVKGHHIRAVEGRQLSAAQATAVSAAPARQAT